MAEVNYHIPTDEEMARIERESLERDEVEPRVVAFGFDTASGRMTLEMRGGASVSFDPRGVRGLESAGDEDLAGLELVGNGEALHWDAVDVQMTTVALLQIVFKMRGLFEAARKGGASRSAAKAQAARANGQKGGRPRKVPQVA